MWMFIVLAFAVGGLVWGWGMVLDGKARRQYEEERINEWYRAQLESPPYTEWEEGGLG